jgi:hypothetical protein
MDAHEQLQLLDRLVTDIGRGVGWNLSYEPYRSEKDGVVEKARRFSIKLLDRPVSGVSRKDTFAFAEIHQKLGCLDIGTRKKSFTDVEIQRMRYAEAVPNSGFGRHSLRWRICQAGGVVYDEAVYWLSVACRPPSSCISCGSVTLPRR